MPERVHSVQAVVEYLESGHSEVFLVFPNESVAEVRAVNGDKYELDLHELNGEGPPTETADTISRIRIVLKKWERMCR